MKHYRTAYIAGTTSDQNTVRIWFKDLNSREYVDKNGNPIDISALPIEDQNAIARWEDDFEDGYNEFDGVYEFSKSYTGNMLRRRAWKVED